MTEPIWVDPDTGGTLPEAWIAAYTKDDNVFWRTDLGHIMNVVDYLLEEREGLR